jgi:hypothetical protein
MRASSVKRRCGARVRVEALLLELLGDGAWHPAAAVRAAVEAVVEGCSQNHFQRARAALGVEARKKAGLNSGWELRLPADAVSGVPNGTPDAPAPTAPNDAVETPDCEVLGDVEQYSPAEQEGVERALREQAERAPIVAPLRKCRCGPKPIPSVDSDGEIACHKCGHPIAGGQS